MTAGYERLPVDQVYRTTIVVRDLEATAREYANFYGITRWALAEHEGFTSANGSNASKGLSFQLIQPSEGAAGIFGDFRRERGEGVQSICLTRLAPSDVPALRHWFDSFDVNCAAEIAASPDVQCLFFDTRELLGGYMVEIAVCDEPDWQAHLSSGDEWVLNDAVTRPASLDFVRETQGLNHFGVVVPDLLAVLPNYGRIFGPRRWRGYHWHTGEGSIEESTYMGEAANHGFSTARGDIGKDRFGRGFGFEIVQPDFGPTHFADFLAARRNGIHHLSLNLAMKDALEWAEFQRWMETLGPACMTGWLRDHSAMYIYSDLSARLGHVVESGIRRRSGHEPDRWYDFNPDGSLQI